MLRPAVLILGFILCLLPGVFPRVAPRAAGPVDLALVLAIDCSYSVDNREFRLQVEGLSRAFREPVVAEAIGQGPLGRIAVAVVQWSDADNQRVVVPWTIVATADDGDALAERLGALTRELEDGGTSITAMIRFGAELIKSGPVSASRQVIDIAADGRNNNGGNPRAMRYAVADEGITVNGLAILNEVPTLDHYFENNVIVGPGSFVIVANDYSAYADSIKRKLLREIIGPTVS